MTTAVVPAFEWQPAVVKKRPVVRSIFHRLVLALVWLAFATSSIAMFEPAPVDALLMGLIILLPLIGLVRVRRELLFLAACWLAITAFGFMASASARTMAISTTHTAITLYLSMAGIVIAAFVARNPGLHTRLILNGYLAASVIAAIPGVAAYLNIPPFSAEIFTGHARASGTFKDPNVFGAFLITGLLIVIHHCLTRPLRQIILSLIAAAIITAGLLFSFSRGAWFAAIIAVAVYTYLFGVTAKRDTERVKLVLSVIGCVALASLILAAAVQSQSVEKLLDERASLAQSYDVGPEGRFGGQRKAIDVILEHPFGVGAGMFARFHHNEDPHNIYISMFLNHGWIGGLFYLIICGATVKLGLRHAFRMTATQPLFLVAFSGLVATMLLGFLVDTEHWRHFFILLGVVWGLMTGDRVVPRRERIVADRRPLLRRSLLIIPPTARAPRLVGTCPIKIPELPPRSQRRFSAKRRPARLLARA